MTPAIETRALSRRFGRTEAVRSVDLVVPEGSIYALMGPNGAGKTTTIKLLLNLLKPSSGEARVLGTDSAALGPVDFARIGYVSEDQALPDWMNVRQLVDYCRPFYPDWDETFSARLLTQFRLPVDRPIRGLSRGMRLKAGLLVALSFRPRLLVLDEPFGGLDPLVRDEVMSGLLDLAGEDGWTIVISSHDMNELERLADHAGFMDQGRLLFSEPMATLLERHREIAFTVEPGGTGSPATPTEWLQLAREGRTVRFVDTAWHPAHTAARVSSLFPGAAGFQVEPMSLRSIFVAHARGALTGVEA